METMWRLGLQLRTVCMPCPVKLCGYQTNTHVTK